MASKDLNRYIKEYLKRQPLTLSMSQMEELIEYDAWLDEQRGTTTRAVDLPIVCADCGATERFEDVCKQCGSPNTASH